MVFSISAVKIFTAGFFARATRQFKIPCDTSRSWRRLRPNELVWGWRLNRYYAGVSRYTTSGFCASSLGGARGPRRRAAYFESVDEAKSDWRKESGPR